MTVTIKLERLDDNKNSDMILLTDARGYAHAIVHIDCFFGGAEKDDLYLWLAAGEAVTCELIIKEDK